MKIDKTTSPLPASLIGEAPQPAARQSGNKTGTAESGGTSVSLGSTTTKLRSMESSIASTPTIDAQKVAEIKQAISEGRFQVDSSKVADRLLNTVRDLISASQR
ncbi:MAG TPA: flagellar biosynthesis anti-sigma factor FlgM [Sideroxyarcus sp.]|nr:flagellar biosynthesis anti-sigma factor FlgM [Sideroxyarcus sp.]